MISKRVVVILIIFALIFATIAIALNVVAGGEKRVSSNLPDSKEDGDGKVGVTILPSIVEDKGNVSG